MKTLIASVSVFAASLGLASCGFTPVYGTVDGPEAGSIAISQINGASGHVMRRELLMLLRPGLPGIEQAELDIRLEERDLDFPLTADGDVLNTTAVSTTYYTLRTEKGVMRGEIETNASFFTPATPYADITARRDAQTRAATDAARKLVSELQIRIGREDAFQDE